MPTSAQLLTIGSLLYLAGGVAMVARALSRRRAGTTPHDAGFDRERHAQHDDLLQELTAASYALDAGSPEAARAHVGQALASARRLASEPFEGGPVRPGTLVPPT